MCPQSPGFKTWLGDNLPNNHNQSTQLFFQTLCFSQALCEFISTKPLDLDSSASVFSEDERMYASVLADVSGFLANQRTAKTKLLQSVNQFADHSSGCKKREALGLPGLNLD